MADYTGTVVPIVDDDSALGVVSDDDFPFLAIVSDQDGNVVAQFPVRTQADGEAKIAEAVAELKRRDEADRGEHPEHPKS